MDVAAFRLPPENAGQNPHRESERKDFESELFPEVYSRENPEEDRLLFLDAEGRPLSDLCWVPDLSGLDPRRSDQEMAHQPSGSGSHHVSVTIPFKLSWLAGRIDFEDLGWQHARNRLKGALTYMWKLILRVHQRARFNKEGCCFCITSP